MKSCSIEGCRRPVRSRKLCNVHYRRLLRHGDPEAGRTPKGEPSEFIARATWHDSDDCLLWPYKQNGHGYGSVWVDGHARQAHRVVLELTEGSPEDPLMEAAHQPVVCHNRLCVNPRHLRWATKSENQLDRRLDGTNIKPQPAKASTS